MRTLTFASFVSAVALLSAGSAAALVSIDHVASTGGPVAVGDTFSVDVIAGWDGTPDIRGIFTSTRWDPAQIQLLSATNPPAQILSGVGGEMVRLGPLDPKSGDPPGTLRTVQYGTLTAAAPGPSVVITRLTFSALAVGDGLAEISAFIAQGDIIIGGPPNFSAIPPSQYSFGSASVAIVPEPSTAFLMLLGLAGLSSRRQA